MEAVEVAVKETVAEVVAENGDQPKMKEVLEIETETATETEIEMKIIAELEM